MEANLTNRDAIRLPDPLIKWSYEPPRAEDVPHALARAIHAATLPPRGPTFVSIPMDDWSAEVDDGYVRHAIERSTVGRAGPDPDAIAALARRLEAAERPALVAGPRSTPRARGMKRWHSPSGRV
jgi:benzoylformate decarboxylase